MTVHAGRPSHLVSLHPGMPEKKKGGKEAGVFILEPDREYWLECAYSRSDVAISRRINPGSTRCEVIVDPKDNLDFLPRILQVLCR